jgi:hypothetical protein
MSVSNRIGRIALAFLVLALAAGSVAIPASAEHGGAVVAKSKCKKKAKRAAAAKKKKKCKRGGAGAGGGATSLPGEAAHPAVTPPVTTPAVHMSGLTLTDNPILGSRSTQGKVTISGAAPSAGQPVTLVSTNPSRVYVPTAVNVAAGQKTATFPVTTYTGSTVTVGVKASIGTSSKQVNLKVVQEPSVKSVSLAYKCFPDVSLVNFGTNRVTLDVPADADTSVGLLSSNTSALTVPSAVTVPAGSSSAIFGVNTGLLPVDSPPGVTVTGSLTGAFGTTEATSAPSSIRNSGSPALVVVGISATATNVAPNSSVMGKVTLNCEAPSPDGTTVTLVSDNPGVTVTPPVIVPAGKLSATFSIDAASDATGDATITATPNDGTPKQVTVTVDDGIPI